MKNIIISIFALFVMTTVSNAQEFGFKKGAKFLEGNIRNEYYQDGSYEEEYRSTILNPKFGYFIKDNIAIGVDLLLMDMFEKNTGDDFKEETHGLSFGVFGCYYFLNLGSRFKTYASLGLHYSNTHYTEVDNGIEYRDPDYKTFTGMGGIGFNFFLTKSLSINYTISDVLYAKKSIQDTPEKSIDYAFDLNLNVFNNIFSNSPFGLNFKF